MFRIDYWIARDCERAKDQAPLRAGIGWVSLAAFLSLLSINMGLATMTHPPSPMGFLCQILGQPANEKSFLLLPVGFPGKTPRFPTSRRSILSESAIFLE